MTFTYLKTNSAIFVIHGFKILNVIELFFYFQSWMQHPLLSNFKTFRCQNHVNLKNEQLSANVEKGGSYRVNRQACCKKAGPYQLPYDDIRYILVEFMGHRVGSDTLH